MTVNDTFTEFHGLPIIEFSPEKPAAPQGPVAWRISVSTYDAEISWPEAFSAFLDQVDPATVTAIVVGGWADPYDKSSAEVVQAIIDAAPRLPALRALFLGDMDSEDCEISWIVQSDVTGLLTAFPALEELGIRGSTQLSLTATTHTALRRLVIESGGLPSAVAQAVAASDFPALEDLELWLGTEDYGGDASIDDLAPFLSGARLPALKRLALCDSEIQTDVAKAVAAAPVVAQLTDLDLSMGVLHDEGGQALMSGVSLAHLTSINLNHNYFTDPVRQQLRTFFADLGVEADVEEGDADADDYGDGEIYYSIAVSE
ncbi:STM4015 family protein [Gordonia hydrophobica]|uniref:STM4015 family protein n=1 Tax=Gordonia hydrophobica TaxID=40516 RepID=A0ABZ2TXS4_9ACTN|nr:STM4015 family protein [Gordonia hydrophobica]MBM7366469.1 hypothetical protein [Gordonia hydrophobica]